jgi:hypothetical protein
MQVLRKSFKILVFMRPLGDHQDPGLFGDAMAVLDPRLRQNAFTHLEVVNSCLDYDLGFALDDVEELIPATRMAPSLSRRIVDIQVDVEPVGLDEGAFGSPASRPSTQSSRYLENIDDGHPTIPTMTRLSLSIYWLMGEKKSMWLPSGSLNQNALHPHG